MSVPIHRFRSGTDRAPGLADVEPEAAGRPAYGCASASAFRQGVDR
ncbi:hypothetical protein [Nocardia carnea]|nr:hypothetical protein [Nocardia carnea]